MTNAVATALGLALLLAGAPVSAGDSSMTGAELLEEAHAAHRKIDYTQASALLKKSLHEGDHDRESLARVYALSGRIAAAFGRSDEAYRHYQRMVLLGGRSLPAGLAPKIVSAFQRARAWLRGTRGIRVRVVRVGADTMTVALGGDPLGMVAGAEAIFGKSGSSPIVRARRIGNGVEIALPTRDARRARIYAVDQFGNRLAETRWRRPAATKKRGEAIAVAAEPSNAKEETRPHTRWKVWGVAALGAGAAALFYGLRAERDWAQLDGVIDNSSSHTFAEAERLQSSGRRNQLYSNVASIATLGLAGVSLYLRARHARLEIPRVRATISGGGASVSLVRSF